MGGARRGEGVYKVKLSQGKVLLSVFSPWKQKAELAEVFEAGSHQPSL